MSGKSARSRKWIAGALHAGRAAAFLTIAVGLNGALAALLPRDQSIYVYLLAVVAVSALSNAFVGITTAVAALILYDWMSTPPRVMPSTAVAIAFLVAAVVTIGARAMMQPRKSAAAMPVEQSLETALEGPAPVGVVTDIDHSLELRKQLLSARAQAESEARLRAETESAARAREAQLERELESLRQRVETASAGRTNDAQREKEVESLRLRAAEESSRSTLVRRDLDVLSKRVAEAEARATALQQGLEVAQRKADEEHARAGRETKLREQLEVAGHESLQKAIADLSAKHDAASLESKQRLEVATKKLDATQKELKEERARNEREAVARAQGAADSADKLQKSIADLTSKHDAAAAESQKRGQAASAKVNALQRELDRTLVSLSEQHARADREAKLRGQLEGAARETLQRTADVSAAHQRDADEARQSAREAEEKATALGKELEQARAELAGLSTTHEEKARVAESSDKRAKALENEIDRLRVTAEEQRRQAEKSFQQRLGAAEEERGSLQRELETSREAVDHERGRADRESEAREKLTGEIAALRQELALSRSDLVAERQRARAEQTQRDNQFSEKFESLRKDLDRARAELETARTEVSADRQRDFDDRVRQITTALQADHESALGAARSEVDAARHDRETAMAELARQREQMAHEYDEKLQRIVAGMAADQENAIGEALLEKEAAKAELRTVAQRMQELDVLRGNFDTMRRDLEAARAEVETERATTARLQSEREQLNREFDAKLQRVASGMAADHENAIGDALLEREGAKAELRTVGKKMQELEALRVNLDTMRHELQAARAEILTERQRAARLQSELDQSNRQSDEKIQRIISGMASDQENAIGDALVDREAAKAELRTQNQRMQELQRKSGAAGEDHAELVRTNAELRAAIDEAKRRAGEEKGALERMDAEWGEKLQKIVTHLASDHEADLGEAMLQKEAARAEARTLVSRVTALQMRLEEERAKFRQATEQWQEERSSLISQAKTAEHPARPPAFAPTVGQPGSEGTPAEGGRQAVVLVVHSDAGIRAIAKHSLQQAGYVVLTAADGLEGLRMATLEKPDVVLAEAVMPKMNARELVQLLKSKRETADVKIILLSGSATMERGIDFRADDVIHNPTDFNDLQAALVNVLSRRGVAS